MRQAGYSVRRALLTNFLISSTIFIGIGLSYFALTTKTLEGVLLAVSAGFLLHVVVHDLLPKPHEYKTVQGLVSQLGVVCLGVILMALVTLFLGEAHVHGDHDGHDYDHDHEGGR